ncbi:MAG: hypothetical protein ACSHYB_14925 [Roseibacillus sp.]
MKPLHGILLVLIGLICILLLQQIPLTIWKEKPSLVGFGANKEAVLTPKKPLTRTPEGASREEAKPLQIAEGFNPERPLFNQNLPTAVQVTPLRFSTLKTDSPFYFFHSSELSLPPEERLRLQENLAPFLSTLFKAFGHQALVLDADALSTTQTPILVYGNQSLDLTPYLSNALQQKQKTTSLEAKEH